MSTFTPNYNLEKPASGDDFKNFTTSYGNNMDIIDEHLGQGGGGSSVSWQQLQVTGDKIATITVSGIPQDVYSPNSQTFSMAISRANINSDEKYSTIFGKIKKWFADLKAVAFSGSYNDLLNTPTNVSDFTNDSGFVTSTVNNLANYYLKSETYTQAQVDALIGAISTISIEVVQTLPTQDIKTNTIYLVPKQTAGTQNVYDEYIYVNNAWELIGDTEIDLSNYVTTTDLATALQDYVTSTGLSTILANYYTSSQIDTLLGGKVNDVEVNGTSVVNGQGVAEVTVPTKTSDLNNDSGYLTDSDVSVTQVVSSGTKIATIDVDGTSTDLYAPAGGGGGSVNDVTVNGTSVVNAQGVAEVTVPDELSDLADDSTHRTVTDTEKNTWSAKVSDNPTFTEASTRANIASGETFATILGKIKKFFTDLKAVAFSGSYNDLSDKPTIPSAQVNSDWNANSGVAQILNKPSLATVATSGKSSDLNNDAGFITSSGSCASATDVTNAIKQGPWWTSGTSHNANALRGEVVFAYNEASQQNVPTTGTLVSFACKKNNYPFQFQSAYKYDALYYRRQNGDNSTWGNWREIIHSGNIGNQSVSYANTAGSAPANGGNADTVDNYHFYSERYVNVSEINQPTAGQAWAINIKTRDWNSDSEVVQLRCTGSNMSSTVIIHLLARTGNFWGYNTTYNNSGIQGAVVTVGNAINLHISLFSAITKVTVFKSWSGGSVETESLRSDYIDITEASFFANKPILHNTVETGKLTATEFQLTFPGLDFYDPIMEKHMYLIRPGTLSAERSIYLPNKNGTIALLSDISSRRYKENIIPLSDDEAKKLLDVEIVNYDYKEGVVEEDERYDQKGAIAEDVVNLIPNAVTYADIDGEQLPDGINYTKFIPYLIKMVQMQQKEIEELKAMIKGE